MAPARNKDIGIAAIDCGADAVYIAGPAFGAREAAGNSVADIAGLCSYAHRFGARIFVTFNTIIYDDELEEAGNLLKSLQDAGVDAFIVQDPAVVILARRKGLTVPLHASTQCSIRTPERARLFESLGFSRIVLERELSLEQIRAIREAVSGEIEFFVHGALCVCYSGECYLSEYLSGRSANRGACIQACRSRYDLLDSAGRVIVKDRALLSLKDYNLLSRLGDLAQAGVCSFKIEGRLKSISYVRNTVRQYSIALDELIARNPEKYRRSSFGRVVKGFAPDLSKTFNRGYTELYIGGRKGKWSSMDAPKSMGEEVGTVRAVWGDTISLTPSGQNLVLSNGDGFAFTAGGDVTGFRGDVCGGASIRTSGDISRLRPGMKLYRNISASFEKKMVSEPCQRLIPVAVDVNFEGSPKDGFRIECRAESADGRIVAEEAPCGGIVAENPARTMALAQSQLGKTAGIYSFSVRRTEAAGEVPLVRSATLNALRRSLADKLDAEPCKAIPLRNTGLPDLGSRQMSNNVPREVTYKSNVANRISREIYRNLGAESVEDAYELTHREGAELMRMRYCIRYELGMCPVHQGAKESGPLYLRNNGRNLRLRFDCARCEMTVSSD